MLIEALHQELPLQRAQQQYRDGETTPPDSVGYCDTTEHERRLQTTVRWQVLKRSLWDEREKTGSIPEQLPDPLHRGLVGVKIPSIEDDPASISAEIMTLLDSSFRSFLDLETAHDFQTWFVQQLESSQKEQSLYLLENLLHHAMLLDTKSYTQTSRIDNAKYSVLPLHTLEWCADFAINRGISEIDTHFKDTYSLFVNQYKQLLTSLDLEVSYENPLLKSTGDAFEIGNTLLTWIDQQVETGIMPLEKALKAALNYLEMYEAQEKEHFVEFLELKYGRDNIAVRNTRKHAIDYNLIKTTNEERSEVIVEGLQEIVETNRVDAAEIDYNAIPDDIEELLFAYATGSYGPPHIGHEETVAVVEEIMEQMMRINPKLYAQLVLAPTISPKTVEHKTSKSAAQVGSATDRAECLIALTRHFARTHITTVLQQEFADNPMMRLKTIESRALESMKQSLGVEELPFKVTFLRVFGIDKILDLDAGTGEGTVKEPKDEYLGPAIVKVRRGGYLSETIRLLQTIRELYPQLTIILTPDTPKGSSSEAIALQDYSYLTLVEHAVGNGKWDRKTISQREAEGIIEKEVSSITAINQGLQVKIVNGQLPIF